MPSFVEAIVGMDGAKRGSADKSGPAEGSVREEGGIDVGSR